jgi:hypothetical protein
MDFDVQNECYDELLRALSVDPSQVGPSKGIEQRAEVQALPNDSKRLTPCRLTLRWRGRSLVLSWGRERPQLLHAQCDDILVRRNAAELALRWCQTNGEAKQARCVCERGRQCPSHRPQDGHDV